MKEIKGELIPLNCGHILFYNDKELDTIKNIIQQNFNEDNNINENI